MKTFTFLASVFFSILVVGEALSSSDDWSVDWDAAYQNVLDRYLELNGSFLLAVPGEVTPLLTVRSMIDSAGEAWGAASLLEAMGRLCVGIGPALTFVTGGPGPLQATCGPALTALRDSTDYDGETVCRYVWESIENTTGQQSGNNGGFQFQPPAPGSSAIGGLISVDTLYANITQIAEDYGFTSYDLDTICPAFSNIINRKQTVPDLIREFVVPAMAIVIPVGATICENWENFNAILSDPFPPPPGVPSFNITLHNISQSTADLLGYANREALCTELSSAVADDNVELLASIIYSDVFGFLTSESRCTKLVYDFLGLLATIFLDITIETLTDSLIQGFTSFANIREGCQYIVAAFPQTVSVDGSSTTPSQTCPGDLVRDACGFCERRDASSSMHMDCNGVCEGVNGHGAFENECGQCVGGTTGRNATDGMDQCNQCESLGLNPMSCFGCDGVPFSGMELDACRVCGGDGTACIAVNMVSPSIIPENSNYQLRLGGAGFQSPGTQCVFVDGNAQTFSAVQNRIGTKFSCSANLTAGTYRVYLSLDGVTLSSTSEVLYVYPPITVSDISATEFDIDPRVDMVSVTMTATSGAFSSYLMTATPYLVINGIDRPFRTTISGMFGGQNNEQLMFSQFPVPSSSSRFVVYPSLNGIDQLSTPNNEGFTVTFYAAAPVVTSLVFSDVGNRLHLDFDRAITIDATIDCSTIFTDTAQLGQNNMCSLRNRRRIVIEVGQGNNLIGVGDNLTLVDNAIKSFNEDYSRTATGAFTVGGPMTPVPVTASLTGATVISSCGNVRLSARRSTGAAGRDFVYSWTVQSVGTVSTELMNAVNDEDGAELNLNGTHLETGTNYTFTVTVMNFFGQSSSAQITVRRSEEATPDVQIIPRGVDPHNVPFSQRFYLEAEVTFYEACGGAGRTEFNWVGSNDVTLNDRTMNRRTLYVEAFSLLGLSEVTFWVNVFRSSERDTITTQSITITTVSSDLIAVITGGRERTVGVESGSLQLDGSSSNDPDNAPGSLAYLWTCLQVTDNVACRSRRISTQLIPAAGSESSSLLTFDPDVLEPGKDYMFTLEVRKDSRVASADVLISAQDQNPPEVIISSKTPTKVRSSRRLTIRALIHHTSAITVDWRTVDEVFDISGDSITNVPFGSSTLSFVTIEPGVLAAGESYTFQVNATDTEGHSGISQVSISVYSDVSSCTFLLGNGDTSYIELDQITFLTENCVTAADAYPLNYRLFVLQDNDGTRRSATRASWDPTLNVVGLSPPPGTNVNTFLMQICNIFRSCFFSTLVVTVNPRSVSTNQEFNDLKSSLVDEEVFKGNYIDALVNFNALLGVSTIQTSGRKRRAAVTSTNAAEQLDLLRNAIDTTVLDTSSAETLLDECDFVSVADLSLADKGEFVNILRDLVEVFTLASEELPVASAEVALEKSGEIAVGLNRGSDSVLLNQIRNLTDSLAQAQFSGATLGAPPIEAASTSTRTSVQHAIPSGTFRSHSGDGAFDIDFGEEIENRYGASWACDTGTCTGVYIRFIHYNNNTDLYSVDESDAVNVVSSILDVSLYDPSSSTEVTIASLSTRIRMNLTVSRPQLGKLYECNFWDSTASQWSTEGLESVTLSDTMVECRANHLTAFALLAVDAPTTASLSTDGITAPPSDTPTQIIVVAAVCGVLAIILIAVGITYCVKKSGGKNNRVDPERIPPMQRQGTMHHVPPPQGAMYPVPPPQMNPQGTIHHATPPQLARQGTMHQVQTTTTTTTTTMMQVS